MERLVDRDPLIDIPPGGKVGAEGEGCMVSEDDEDGNDDIELEGIDDNEEEG